VYGSSGNSDKIEAAARSTAAAAVWRQSYVAAATSPHRDTWRAREAAGEVYSPASHRSGRLRMRFVRAPAARTLMDPRGSEDR